MSVPGENSGTSTDNKGISMNTGYKIHTTQRAQQPITNRSYNGKKDSLTIGTKMRKYVEIKCRNKHNLHEGNFKRLLRAREGGLRNRKTQDGLGLED